MNFYKLWEVETVKFYGAPNFSSVWQHVIFENIEWHKSESHVRPTWKYICLWLYCQHAAKDVVYVRIVWNFTGNPFCVRVCACARVLVVLAFSPDRERVSEWVKHISTVLASDCLFTLIIWALTSCCKTFISAAS
jgi:hypothetical protein